MQIEDYADKLTSEYDHRYAVAFGLAGQLLDRGLDDAAVVAEMRRIRQAMDLVEAAGTE